MRILLAIVGLVALSTAPLPASAVGTENIQAAGWATTASHISTCSTPIEVSLVVVGNEFSYTHTVVNNPEQYPQNCALSRFLWSWSWSSATGATLAQSGSTYTITASDLGTVVLTVTPTAVTIDLDHAWAGGWNTIDGTLTRVA